MSSEAMKSTLGPAAALPVRLSVTAAVTMGPSTSRTFRVRTSSRLSPSLELPGQAAVVERLPVAAVDADAGGFEVGRDACDANLQLRGRGLADAQVRHAGRPLDLAAIARRDEGLRVIRPVLAQHVVAPLAKPGGLAKRLVVEDHQPAFVAARLRERVLPNVIGRSTSSR